MATEVVRKYFPSSYQDEKRVPDSTHGLVPIEHVIDKCLPDAYDIQMYQLGGRTAAIFITFRLPQHPDIVFDVYFGSDFDDGYILPDSPVHIFLHTNQPDADRSVLGRFNAMIGQPQKTSESYAKLVVPLSSLNTAKLPRATAKPETTITTTTPSSSLSDTCCVM